MIQTFDDEDRQISPIPQPARIAGPPRLPTHRTAVGLLGMTPELLIVNQSDRSWIIHHRSQFLLQIDARDQQVTHAHKVGLLSVTPVEGDHQTNPTSIILQPGVWGVELLRRPAPGDEERHELRPLTVRPRPVTLAAAGPIEELNLLAETAKTLNRFGLLTLGQTLLADVDDLLAQPPMNLRAFFDLMEQLHGLHIT